MDFKGIKRIHFVGIKGIAMAALAVWAKEAGFHVTGSDVEETFPSDEVLGDAKVDVLGFDTRNIIHTKPDLVIYTGAHGGKENAEVIEAGAQRIRVLPHGKALGEIMKPKRQISVAGSHGKTTTAAMIATILTHAGHDPSWVIGCGKIRGLGLPGHHGRGALFVAEADEYVTDPGHDTTPRFLWQKPDLLVITNIDWDHPDVYESLADVQKAFNTLKKQAKLTIESRDVEVSNVRFGDERTFFTLSQHGMKLYDFTLKVPGRHNALNAALAAMAAKELGLSWKQIASGLLQFGGTKRRFEQIGRIGDIAVFDDYAHHPTEIRSTLAAARDWYPGRRILAIFQPHTYSRTKALFTEFSESFGNAHEVVITDIYASARETEDASVSGRLLAQETAKHHPQVFYGPAYADVEKILAAHMKAGDVIIFMGAGDIYGWSQRFCKKRTTG